MPVIQSQVVIVTTPQQDQRLAAAFGSYLSLGRDATGPEIRDWMVAQLRVVVQSYELEQAKRALQPTPFDPS